MSSTLRLSNRSEAADDSEQTDSAEQRMRRALGLLPAGERPVRPAPAGPGGARNTRNPGQGINRVAVAEAALATERQARERAEKLLSEAEATTLKLTTRLGQAELVRDEAVASLAAERQRRELAEAQLGALTQQPPQESASSETEPAPAPRKRGRKPAAPVEAAPAAEDEPVEWWVPGWRAR